jgi:hypothetical protein
MGPCRAWGHGLSWSSPCREEKVLVILGFALVLESIFRILLARRSMRVTGVAATMSVDQDNDNSPVPFNACRRPCNLPFSETKWGETFAVTQLGLWRSSLSLRTSWRAPTGGPIQGTHHCRHRPAIPKPRRLPRLSRSILLFPEWQRRVAPPSRHPQDLVVLARASLVDVAKMFLLRRNSAAELLSPL